MIFSKKLLTSTIASIGLMLSAKAAFATDVNFTSAVDDFLTFYISTDDALTGTEIGTKSFGPVGTITGSLTPSVTNYLHVLAQNNPGGSGAFAGEFSLSDEGFQFANGTQFLSSKPSTLQASNTGFGADYFTPSNYGTVSSHNSSVFTALFNQPNSTEILWGKTDSDTTVYFSVAVFAAALLEPETYALMLAGLGLVGAFARRRQSTNA